MRRGPLLELDRVAIGYDRGGGISRFRSRPVKIVDELLLSIQPGETLAMVGESGSGKTTIARAIAGLIAPLAGTIAFKGEAVPATVRDRSSDLRREIQYVFQNPDASLNPRMPIGGILARPLEVFFKANAATVRDRVAQTLEDVRLDQSYAGQYPDQLSGGERQRAAIARSIIVDPVLLICDEVLSALDVSVQASIIELLRRLRREHHLSMLFISHDLAVVGSMADRVAVLFRGTIVELGDVGEIFAPPFHPYTHSLLMAVPGAMAVSGRREAKTREASQPSGQGCVFAGRCPWQIGDVCRTEEPPWRHSGIGLRIRCHLTLEELKERAAEPRTAVTTELAPAADFAGS